MTAGRALRTGLADSARRIAPLTWPLLVGQLSVLAFGTIDTVLVARASATDLAALAVGGAAHRDAFYAPYALTGRGLDRPQWHALRSHLRLGLPMGATILIEVTAFSFMALFISRLGTTPVAGHQIVINLVSLLFVMPIALGSATSTLVAQSIGAGDTEAARRLGWHQLAIGCAVALALGLAVALARRPVLGLYTSDPLVIAAALPLVAWLVAFHLADAAQAVAAAVLRAYKITVLPLVIFALALWGVGLAGGYALAFDLPGGVPAALRGAPGFWFASTVGLVVAAVLLIGLQAWVLRLQRPAAPAHR